MSIKTVSEYLSEILPEGSHEAKVVESVKNLLYRQLPNTAAGCTNRISEIDSIRSELVSLIYQINSYYSDINKEYKFIYDKEFTRLTALGRPSQAAIDSEISSKYPELFEIKIKLEKLDNLRALLNQYIRSLDQSRNSCIENWHDIRRVD